MQFSSRLSRLLSYYCLVGTVSLRKHAYIISPHKIHFYKVKLGFTGVYIIFLISAKN